MHRLKNVLFPCFYIIAFLITVLSPGVQAASVESYGLLPSIRSLVISPDGEHYAYIERRGESDIYMVVNIKTKELVGALNSDKIKARSISFATNKHVILRASKAQRLFGYRGQWEHSGAYSYNLETKKLKVLLKGTKDIYPAQSGLGRIVGLNRSKELVYMPAFGDRGKNPPYNLYKVNLDRGYGRIHQKGNSSTIDWFVSDKGEVIAREDYVEKKQEHRIYSKVSGKWKKIYSLKTSIPRISVQAISSDSKKLYFIDGHDDREAVYSMDLMDGEIDGPVFSRDNTDIETLDIDINRHLKAVVYSGFKSDYQRADQFDQSVFDRLNNTFPLSNVSIESETADKKHFIVKVSGVKYAGSYMLFDADNIRLKVLATEYPDVSEIGSLKAIRYKARDELKIPAIITLPPSVEKPEKMPLIVMPHGGPESYDRFQFDWMAQFFASKGYVVLQPNFRGSTGFGYRFRNAGRGKWGREMQDDVSDGVKTLVAVGYADPERVCIVGASYGGYSALAGGAFSSDMYRCVISINGVADLPVMLRDSKQKHGKKHWVNSYWKEVIGDSKSEQEKLKNISPVNFADKFVAPVLLIHGKDDTVVPFRQSTLMKKALKKAGKNVELVTLESEDHWLSTSSARLESLKAIDSFLQTHNPPD